MDAALKKVVRVFLASPGDVLNERERAGVVVESLNRTLESELGIRIELIRWETHVAPLMGRPEEVVLEGVRMSESDVFVGILWLRFGTPTGGVRPESGGPILSGTEEEFHLAYESWKRTGRPQVMFYRCTRPPEDIRSLEADQYGNVARFFARFEHNQEHPGLVGTYSEPEEFERRLREDLTHVVRRLASGGPSTPRFDLSTTHRGCGFDKLFLPDYNDERSSAKREALLQAKKIRIIGYSGHAFLASIGHRYRNELVARLDSGAFVSAVLTNPWSERGLLISMAEADPVTHAALYRAYATGDCSAIDPIALIERAAWYSLKFRNSVAGSRRLIESYPGQVQIRLTDHELPAAVLLTETLGFFEPYLHVDSDVRLKRTMLTFDMQIATSSYLYQHASNFFDFLWLISEPFQEFFDHEESHKKRLIDALANRGATWRD
ncbi:MAG TPA: hypothetical protein VES88_10025 [Gemmatimonadaceae bacterium]|nr:hypothetical protein [Gemmatimonadaceae bacterium]